MKIKNPIFQFLTALTIVSADSLHAEGGDEGDVQTTPPARCLKRKRDSLNELRAQVTPGSYIPVKTGQKSGSRNERFIINVARGCVRSQTKVNIINSLGRAYVRSLRTVGEGHVTDFNLASFASGLAQGRDKENVAPATLRKYLAVVQERCTHVLNGHNWVDIGEFEHDYKKAETKKKRKKKKAKQKPSTLAEHNTGNYGKENRYLPAKVFEAQAGSERFFVPIPMDLGLESKLLTGALSEFPTNEGEYDLRRIPLLDMQEEMTTFTSQLGDSSLNDLLAFLMQEDDASVSGSEVVGDLHMTNPLKGPSILEEFRYAVSNHIGSNVMDELDERGVASLADSRSPMQLVPGEVVASGFDGQAVSIVPRTQIDRTGATVSAFSLFQADRSSASVVGEEQDALEELLASIPLDLEQARTPSSWTSSETGSATPEEEAFVAGVFSEDDTHLRKRQKTL